MNKVSKNIIFNFTVFIIFMALAMEAIGINILFLKDFSYEVWVIMEKIWVGLLFAMFSISLLHLVPSNLVLSALGTDRNKIGRIWRAVAAGTLMDMCSHGILLIGMKLYKQGATIGQVMAFLIATPWNSFSLLMILVTMIGIKWTLIFTVLTLIVALIVGYIFEILVEKGVLPSNPNKSEIILKKDFMPEFKKFAQTRPFTFPKLWTSFKENFDESKMILRWIFLGVIIAATVRTIIPIQTFETLFGPSIEGLGLTLIITILLEICSEGASPIAADFLVRAKAPGNSFVFLMGGITTDYTEILALRQTTKSWKISLFLPLISLPLVILIAIILNVVGYI